MQHPGIPYLSVAVPKVASVRRRDDRGSLMWPLLVALIVGTLVTVFAASIMATVIRSTHTTNTTYATQYVDVAVGEAVARLNAGERLPGSAAESTSRCEKPGSRPMCWKYWALPVPGNARDPLRYDLIAHVWVDRGREGIEPETGVYAVRVPLEVISYQSLSPLAPIIKDGYVAYHATPASLFGNALHSFSKTSIEGPQARFRSYNSRTGDSGTGGAVVSTSGWVAYGTETRTDMTLLYNGAQAGDQTSRCTGESCGESDVRVVPASYLKPTAESVAWMDQPQANKCATHLAGDWVASEHGGALPSGNTCINGSLIVDMPTTTSSPRTNLFVKGSVDIRANLNAPPAGTYPTPASLVIYTSGQAVSFATSNGAAIAALIFAPVAACGNNPGFADTTEYYGSLVCDTVSLAGKWTHQFDEGAIADYVDPVPDAKRTYSPGVAVRVDEDDYDVAPGYETATCVQAPPRDAYGYWKLDEPSGLLARDSATTFGDAGWSGGVELRTDGVCGKATRLKGSAPAIQGGTTVNALNGMTLEFWARNTTDSAADVLMAAGGVRVQYTSNNKIRVTDDRSSTVNGTTAFTVQNTDSWHLYTVTVTKTGAVVLYVDGAQKATLTLSELSTESLRGGLLIGQGNDASAVDEAVYYDKVLTAAQVAERFTWWTNPPKFSTGLTLTDPGTPFTAPTNFANNGSTPDLLKVKWTKPTGTFPANNPLASYTVQVKSGSAWNAFGNPVAGGATTFEGANPPSGSNVYRVCATYNGDTKCSGEATIVTLSPPAAPVLTATGQTSTGFKVTWPAVKGADSYERRYQTDGGAWSAWATAASGVTIPSTPGTKVVVQVRGKNAAGVGAVGSVTAATPPAAPVLTITSQTNTGFKVTWPAVAKATSYERRVKTNSGTWGAWATVSSGFAVGPTTQGTKVAVEVRAKNANGAGSAASKSVTLGIDAPKINKWETSTSFPNMQARLTNSGAAICPSGTTVQSRKQDKRTTTSTWNAYGGWVNGSSTAGAWHQSSVNTYAAGAHQKQQVRCANTTSAVYSAVTTHGPVEIWHPMPKPSGLWADAGGVGGWRVAAWGGTCAAGTTIEYDPKVKAAWGTWDPTWTTQTRYSRTSDGWNTWTVSISARCKAGTRVSAVVSHTATGM